MSKEVWKEYEDNQLTHSAAHYLMTIHDLLEDHGYARVTDIAKRLNITRGSCSISLKSLKRRRLVKEDDNKFLSLSDEGQRLAEMVEHNDELLEFLFKNILGVEENQAEIDACKIEHLLSIETSMALHNLVQVATSGSKVTEEFLNELRRHQPASCARNAEQCELCHSICFVDAPKAEDNPDGETP